MKAICPGGGQKADTEERWRKPEHLPWKERERRCPVCGRWVGYTPTFGFGGHAKPLVRHKGPTEAADCIDLLPA